MSGHAGTLEGLVDCESDLRVARESWDLPRQILHLNHDSIRLMYALSYVLSHDYRMMWAEPSLPVGPNLKITLELLPQGYAR